MLFRVRGRGLLPDVPGFSGLPAQGATRVTSANISISSDVRGRRTFGRDTRDEGTWGHDSTLQHQGVGGYERAFPNNRAIEDSGVHADERASLHRAAVQHRSVADADLVTQMGGVSGVRVDDGRILDATAGADRDAFPCPRAGRRSRRLRMPAQ